MKIKPKQPVSKSTTLRVLGNGDDIEITHSQSVRQSANYQSAEVVFGVTFKVANNEQAIKQGIKRAEALIEEPLVDKLSQQRELLLSMSK